MLIGFPSLFFMVVRALRSAYMYQPLALPSCARCPAPTGLHGSSISAPSPLQRPTCAGQGVFTCMCCGTGAARRLTLLDRAAAVLSLSLNGLEAAARARRPACGAAPGRIDAWRCRGLQQPHAPAARGQPVAWCCAHNTGSIYKYDTVNTQATPCMCNPECQHHRLAAESN